MPKEPKVTGLSPNEGPPGTKVTIRGENLGTGATDLTGLTICGVNCLLTAEWVSPSKITCKTGLCKGKGEVIVTTRSGGLGTCTVTFRGYVMQTGPLEESAVWIDESTTTDKRGRSKSSSALFRKNEDPLGMSMEGKGKFPIDQLEEMFPEGSGDPSNDKFLSEWFLIENHHHTSFEDLKTGLSYLKRKSTQRSEGPLAFMKGNLTSIMDCQDALAVQQGQWMKATSAEDTMHQDLLKDESTSEGGSITEKLETLLNNANEKANAMYQDVLGRKDKADATRNALNVLQRFRFLFSLPGSIERNIQNGDYDIVINDYAKAKSLFADTEVQMFKRVYLEVEKQIETFRGELTEKLMQLPSSLDEQTKLIRYLMDLGAPGDPAWDCLVNQHRWLLQLLFSCKEEHIKQAQTIPSVAGSEGDTPSHTPLKYRPSVGTPGSVFTPGHSSVKRIPSFGSTQSPDQAGWKFKTPQRVQFVDDLTDVLLENFPDLWKLWEGYSTGSLLNETAEKADVANQEKETRFKKMVKEVMSVYSKLLRAAFLPQSLSSLPKEERAKYGVWPEGKYDNMAHWLPQFVRTIRSCNSTLSGMNLPDETTHDVRDVAQDTRVHCVTTLLQQATEDVKALNDRETWTVERDDRGGITTLPLLFENIITELIQHLKEVVQSRAEESEIFRRADTRMKVSKLCEDMLSAFSDTMDQLAFRTETEAEATPTSQQPSSGHDELTSPSEHIPPLERRLVTVLSNCSHTREKVLPKLIDLLEKNGYPEVQKVQKGSQSCFSALDEKLFDAYLEQKADPLVGALEPGVYAGYFMWDDCLPPRGVRNYVKEALMNLIAVHAEVFSISPLLVERVLSRLLQALAEEMLRLMECVTEWSANGANQARLELCALQDALALYKTPESSKSFHDALQMVPPVTSAADRKNLEELMNKFKSNMQLQLTCFRSDSLKRTLV
ncbi:Hypp4243 [Branchiostoma lanceolatum]|uniref:Exocyst complex component 2 n=1 Tax=Branchiostoma lanceolatum TaxID=7740 RepID=A0A8K0A8J0_BRALA|nr:Hypp4243 [Branchiostoma lanceolatum]